AGPVIWCCRLLDAHRTWCSLIADRVWENGARDFRVAQLARGVRGGAVASQVQGGSRGAATWAQECWDGPYLLGDPDRRTRRRTGPEQQGALVMPDPTPPDPGAAALPSPAFTDARVTLYHGDAVERLRLLPEASADALVSAPPYGLSFNGQAWDDPAGFRESLPHLDTAGMDPPEVFEAWCGEWAAGALQALKPGAHLAAFGGARTWHRMVRGLENA